MQIRHLGVDGNKGSKESRDRRDTLQYTDPTSGSDGKRQVNDDEWRPGGREKIKGGLRNISGG